MNNDLQNWNKNAWAILEQLPYGLGADLQPQWRKCEGRGKVVVTLFGPYDTGKSTLIRRLLVDDGCPVPEWLTISARRETFEQNEVEVCGVIVRDTPGVSGGNDVHEASAEAALLNSDAVVIVLPPQLVTGDQEAATAIMSVLDGSRFHCSPSSAFASGSLFIVLARMDEGGAMPDEDLAGYEALIKLKREELGKLLSAARVEESRIEIHTLVADWSGLVGDTPEVTPDAYDRSRAWDGVGAFAASLRALADRHVELRLWSERRFLLANLGTMRHALNVTLNELRLSRAAAANEVEALALQTQRLSALIDDAHASLDHRIAEEVRSACLRGDTTPGAVKSILHERIGGSLERWWTAQDGALERLADEIDAEVEQRHSRPDWKAMVEDLDDADFSRDNESEVPGESKWNRENILRVNQKLRTVIREASPLALGMPIKQAKDELEHLRKAGSFQEYAKQSGRRKGTFHDASHANRAKTVAQAELVFDAAIPAILEIAGLVGELRGENQEAEARISKRTELQKKVDETAKAVAEKTWQKWHDEGLPAALSSALRDAHASGASRSQLLQNQRNIAEQALAAIQSVLDEGGFTRTV